MYSARTRAYFYLILVVIIWGIAGIVIKLILNKYPWDIVLFYRFLISTVIFLPFLKISTLHPLKNKNTLLLVLAYTFMGTTLGLGLLFAGTERTSLVSMSLLSLFAPILTILAGFLFLKDRITWTEKLGISITFLGSLLILIEPLVELKEVQGSLTGNLLVMGSILCAPPTAIMLKKLLRQGMSPFLLANLNFVIGLISFIPIILIGHGFNGSINIFREISLPYHAGVWFLAVFSGTIAYTLANIAQRTIEISEQAVFNYLYPILSAVLAVQLLKEVMTPLAYFGAGMTIVGIFVAEVKRRTKHTTLEEVSS
jgi:drug/metabolite transporter (DMT)-like permease